jgi:hypothetical protein
LIPHSLRAYGTGATFPVGMVVADMQTDGSPLTGVAVFVIVGLWLWWAFSGPAGRLTFARVSRFAAHAIAIALGGVFVLALGIVIFGWVGSLGIVPILLILILLVLVFK